ncbi:hypothetical protein IT396_03660 [Candidatus Nomurabacteria bacterium]|nr:hypothetical protein [Candidatus Nomurabacteria bacterium]
MRQLRNIAITLGLFAPAILFAQTAVPDPVRYVVSPDTPGANQVVTIDIEGTGSFIGESKITWSQDGSVVKSGVGERQYSFTTGAFGKTTTIRVTIESTAGNFNKTFNFSPSTVTLLWEADTSIPPLYRGKALYSAGSPLTVVALPTVYQGTSRVSPNVLSYQWQRGGEPVPAASGLGRTTFRFSGDQLKTSEDIQVDVYAGTVKVGVGYVSIPTTEPLVILYQHDALRGPIYDQALTNGISLIDSEISIKAEPFYYSNPSKKGGALSYAWRLDGAEATGPDAAQGILTLRQTGTGEGESLLSVSLQNNNPAEFVQAAENAVRILFGQGSGSPFNLFNL